MSTTEQFGNIEFYVFLHKFPSETLQMLEENTGFMRGNPNDFHRNKNSAWTRAKTQ
jgi:hypothetical protein